MQPVCRDKERLCFRRAHEPCGSGGRRLGHCRRWAGEGSRIKGGTAARASLIAIRPSLILSRLATCWGYRTSDQRAPLEPRLFFPFSPFSFPSAPLLRGGRPLFPAGSLPKLRGAGDQELVRRQANAVLKEGHRIVAKNLRCMRRVGRALCSAAALSAQSPEPLACRRSRRRAGPTSKPAGKKKKTEGCAPGCCATVF